ncbi:hypothetical protein PVAND_011805 [Polypedilum vanderplanki]|uniref:Gamma-tubulin complex component 6 n=1 Tax=Polypedilum vanderplanki TaxID=319348 RepID=A0A9J6CLI2_POLVA|nr:hypothetical protein PVAND_011805 [Polypedilum vanderplanki]
MSVYHLINNLCGNLLKEVDHINSNINLQEAKNIAFEALIKKSYSENINFDANIKELRYFIFERALTKNSSDIKDIEAFIELLQNETSSDLLQQITAFLIKLKDSNPNSENKHNFLQIQSINDLSKNKYFSQIPLNQESSISSRTYDHQNQRNQDYKFFSNVLELNIGKKNIQLNCLKLKPKLPLPVITPTKSCNFNIKKNRHFISWENISNDNAPCEKPLYSESSDSFTHQRMLAKSNNSKMTSTEITTISHEKLINDVKLLLIGIESELFQRTGDTLIFHAIKKIHCDGISNLNELLERFLEAGTCYKRLKIYTGKNIFNQNQIFAGFMFKAFCDRIETFLNYCRDIIYSQEISSLLELFTNTENLRRIIIEISKFLKIHPSTASNQQQAIVIPKGSEFLRLLYDEYSKTVNNEMRSFYIELLKSCCKVYYQRYQEWFYQGKLEDPNEELFIYYVNHYTINTKYYFDRAYIIRRQSVPTFLSTCADEMLLCGKYTGLLKSYNPAHPLFRMKKPSFKICLTFKEINDQRKYCKEFTEKARLECGEPISLNKIMEEYRLEKFEKYRNAEMASVKNFQKWNQLQEEKNQKIRQYREHQQKELQKELELIEERRILKRYEEIQTERIHMDMLEDIEKEEFEKENAELKAKIDIYQKLNNDSEVSIEQIKLIFPSPDDILNANNPVEENLSPHLLRDELNNVVENEPKSEAQKNKFKAMSHEYNHFSMNNDYSKKTIILTDAQKNKLKVMGHEYNIMKIDEKLPPEIRVQNYDEMSDLQKNRLKVLSTEFEQIKYGNVLPKKEKFIADISNEDSHMTDLQRNRKKVLSHEFGYDSDYLKIRKTLINENNNDLLNLSLDLIKTDSLKPALILESPMSVTSDHFNNDFNETTEKDEVNFHKEHNSDEDNDDDLLKAFEEAIENNRINVEIKQLEDAELRVSHNEIHKLDTVTLSHFLQTSLTLPLSSYMDILNNEILKMYIQDLNILSHFKSLRNYFLLMNGEFCSSICHEMFLKIENGSKPIELLNYHSLHQMLDTALSGSRFYDKNTDNLSFIVQCIPEKFELYSPGILNMLTLSYNISWPLTLILNPETMNQYKCIFNYLMKLKRISFALEQCFQILKDSHKEHGMEISKSLQYKNVQQTRHKMMQFISCLENYVTRNVIQISWKLLIQDLKTADSFLDIYRKHTSYLKRILFLCLLTKNSHEFYKSIEDIFKIILKFYKHLKSKNWNYTSETFIHENYDKIANDDQDFNKLLRYVIYLGNKIVKHGNQKEMLDLVQLIDINGYYSENN